MHDCLWMCVVDNGWSSLDGEKFVGDQELYYEQDLQDQFEQGKYSMGLSLLSYSLYAINIIMHLFLVKDDLAIDPFPWYLLNCIEYFG
jgi:predicted helicase